VDSRLHLAVDTVLDGCYRIMRVLGSGGFGITYAAEDTNLGTTVAIKEYYPEEFGDRDSVGMSVRAKSERHKSTFEWGRTSFVHEARTLARFQHPSVVRVTRVFEANSTAYMVMDFEEGRSLEAWLKSLGRLPTQEELDRIAAPLLDALEMMHAQDFLHRDIAPDNIIIRGNGTPVLLDFGAARRAVAERSRALTGIIKAGYSPHEQYTTDSRLQGPWSDIYALGATLYRAIVGRPPEEATLRLTDDPMVPAARATTGSYRAGFPAAIDACLVVRPRDRPQSVAALRPLLLGTVPPESVRLAPPPESTRLVPPPAPLARQSSPWRWIAVAGIVLAAAAFIGFEYRSRLEVEAAKREAERKQMADAAAARKRAEEEAAARKRADEEAAAKARVAAEAQRQKEEAERRDAEARAQREAEARRLANAGWLGVKIQNVDQDIAASLGLPEAKGAIVNEVTSPGPALEAGLKTGDVILSVNGNPVSDSRDLARQIAGYAPNTAVELRIMRNRGYHTVSVKLGKFPAELARQDEGKIEMGYLGVTVSSGIGTLKDNLVVREVEGSSDAAQKGIKTGDVILEMSGNAIGSLKDFINAVREAQRLGRKAMLLRVRSGEQVRYVAVQLAAPK
jgi:sRNA-binding protein